MKRGPMSSTDKDFLLKNKNKTLKFLSKKTGRTEESIKQFLDQFNVPEVKLETKPEEPKEVKEESAISSSLSRNKKYGAVIMTPTASMISDEKRKNRPAANKKDNRFIFIMNPDKQ
jgi:hypothetical protein